MTKMLTSKVLTTVKMLNPVSTFTPTTPRRGEHLLGKYLTLNTSLEDAHVSPLGVDAHEPLRHFAPDLEGAHVVGVARAATP